MNRLDVQITRAIDPLFVDFNQKGSYQPDSRLFVREYRDDPRSSSEFTVEALDDIRRSNPLPELSGKCEIGQGLVNMLFQPLAQSRRCSPVFYHHGFLQCQSHFARGGIEDIFQGLKDFALHYFSRDVGIGITHEMSDTPLPWHSREHGFSGFAKPLVGVADDQPNTSETSGHKIGKEPSPMNFSLTQLARQAKNLSFASFIDPDGPENGYAFDAAGMTNLFVTGIQIHHRIFAQGPGKECGDFLVQSLREPRNLRRGNLEATEIFGDLRDLSRRNTRQMSMIGVMVPFRDRHKGATV